MSRTIRDYLEDILETINATEDFIKELDYDSFAQDRKTIFAVSRTIEIIGKHQNKYPLKLQHSTLMFFGGKLPKCGTK